MIWQIIRIGDFVDGFFQKPFWFFLRIFSILGCIRLRSITSMCVAKTLGVMPQCFLVIPRSHFLGKGWGRSCSSISLLCFAYPQRLIIEEVCRQIFLPSILQEIFRRGRVLFILGFSVISGRLRSLFLKCSFHFKCLTSWLVAYNFVLELLFLLLTAWRCPWCDGYRHWKWRRRPEIKSWTKLFAFHRAQIKYKSNYSPSKMEK